LVGRDHSDKYLGVLQGFHRRMGKTGEQKAQVLTAVKNQLQHIDYLYFKKARGRVRRGGKQKQRQRTSGIRVDHIVVQGYLRGGRGVVRGKNYP